ncbi:MAG: hypothetical protein IPN19_05175 [Elusimicrobia bacterium]|nr:hypothetical protein [Elusimicrobiota bacterium]
MELAGTHISSFRNEGKTNSDEAHVFTKKQIYRREPGWLAWNWANVWSAQYELWKDLVYRHGPGILKNFPGFHDEKLKGEREWQRSSRLSLKYRVVYFVDPKTGRVLVLEISPHDY